MLASLMNNKILSFVFQYLFLVCYFSFSSFYLAFLIFNELKLIETLKKENIEIKINKIKTDLENSSIYRKINKFLEGI